MQELFGELKLKEHLFRDAPKMLPENKSKILHLQGHALCG
jgi:hypothetical protein